MADFSSPEPTPNPPQGWILGIPAAAVIASGGGAPAVVPLSVVGVAQYAKNAVDVGFNREPFASNPYASNDALNLDNYTLSPADRLLQHAQWVGPGVIRLFFDGDLTPGTTYTVTVANISGEGMTLTAPLSGSFVALGVAPSSTRQTRPEAEQRRDILNTGTLGLESTGDLANEDGIQYLRKRILRRAQTLLGAFVNLPGYGGAEPLKTLLRGDTARRVRARLRAQIRLEPDVVTSRVVVSTPASNILVVTIRATAETGTVDLAFRATITENGIEFSGA